MVRRRILGIVLVPVASVRIMVAASHVLMAGSRLGILSFLGLFLPYERIVCDED